MEPVRDDVDEAASAALRAAADRDAWPAHDDWDAGPDALRYPDLYVEHPEADVEPEDADLDPLGLRADATARP